MAETEGETMSPAAELIRAAAMLNNAADRSDLPDVWRTLAALLMATARDMHTVAANTIRGLTAGNDVTITCSTWPEAIALARLLTAEASTLAAETSDT